MVAAKRQRFAHKDIAHALKRTQHSIDMRVRRLEEEGVLMRHRREELELLERLLAEARAPEMYRNEVL